MKQILLTHAVVFLSCVSCLAQTKITFGAQAKTGFSDQWHEEPLSNSQPLLTYGAAIYADFPIYQNLSFRPHVGWLRKGFKQRVNVFSGPGGQLINVVENKFQFDYLPLDVTLVYSFRTGKQLRPYVQLGARGSLLINQQTFSKSGNRMVSRKSDDGAFRRFTVGGLMAVGVQWKRFSVGVESNYDFNSYLNPPPVALFDDLKPKFKWFGLNITCPVTGI